MAGIRIARRYAKSLLDLGIENNVAPQLYQDMKLVLSVIKSNREMALFLKNPIINTDKKDAVMKAIFEGKLQKMSLTFFQIITRKKREYYIQEIASAFVELYKQYNNEQTAHLVTAIKVDDNIRSQMLELIAKTTSDKIDLIEKVDPSIIGGFVLSWGDKQVDTSVTRKLHALRQDFKDNLYQKDY